MVKKGLEMLKKVIGEEKAHILTSENPARILDSKALNLTQPEKPLRKRGRIKRLLSWG